MNYGYLKKLEEDSRYLEILNISEIMNAQLTECFISTRAEGGANLADVLLIKIEEIIESLKTDGHRLYNHDYCGSVEYQNSEQTWGPDYSEEGLFLYFVGFSVQLSWHNT